MNAELPQLVVEYIALSTDWRKYRIAFYGLCKHMAADESLPSFWRAAAYESLGATHPDTDPGGRIYYFDEAIKLVDKAKESDEEIYINTCVTAGRNETHGQDRNIDTFERVARLMIAMKWFNAPGRLKALLDEIKKNNWVITPSIRALIETFRQAEAAGDHAFSPRQTKSLKEAYPSYFPPHGLMATTERQLLRSALTAQLSVSEGCAVAVFILISKLVDSICVFYKTRGVSLTPPRPEAD